MSIHVLTLFPRTPAIRKPDELWEVRAADVCFGSSFYLRGGFCGSALLSGVALDTELKKVALDDSDLHNNGMAVKLNHLPHD